MYTNAFVLSLLGLTVTGRQLSGNGNQKKMSDYLGYVGTHAKSYSENSEFIKRLGQFMDNDDYINECNYKADHTDEDDPVHCAHNQFSDWTEDEYLDMLGFVGGEIGEDEDESESDDEGSGMLTMAEATTVDHTKYMTEVKD